MERTLKEVVTLRSHLDILVLTQPVSVIFRNPPRRNYQPSKVNHRLRSPLPPSTELLVEEGASVKNKRRMSHPAHSIWDEVRLPVRNEPWGSPDLLTSVLSHSPHPDGELSSAHPCLEADFTPESEPVLLQSLT